MSLNFDKCVTVSYGRHIGNTHSYLMHRQGSDTILQNQDSFKGGLYFNQLYHLEVILLRK